MVRVVSKARKLILKLATSAWWQEVYFNKGRSYTDTPGSFIERLSPEERDILKQLKSEDVVGIMYPPH